MTAQDRARWDDRYTQRAPATSAEAVLPAVFAPHAALFPTAGHALELACGRGQSAIWLARRGLAVKGYDISSVAIAQARELADSCDVGERCRFAVVDLDAGLPNGPAAEAILCHKFRDARLDGPVLDRLAPGGLLAISALSEVGAAAGPFRIKPGELERAFSALEVIAAGAADGEAWLLGRRR
ncbi:class I SAM-dependent methyltransferase [soil metagenome]